MAVEDFLDGEVAIAVAATAAISSSRVRKVFRRGVVYGLAGVLRAGDALASTAREAGRAAGRPGVPDPHGTEGTAAGATTGTGSGSGTLPGLLRGGVVSGLARAMTAGEALSATARSAGRQVQQATATVMQDADAQAQAGGRPSAPQPTRPAVPGEADVPGAGGAPVAKADPDA